MTIAQIKKSKIFSPGMLDGKIVKFLPSVKNTFYVQRKDETEYARDDKNKYIILDMETVLKARLEYLELYADQEKEEMIEQEIEKIKKELLESANKIIEIVGRYEAARDREPYLEDTAFKNIIQNAMRFIGPSEIDKAETKAKMFFAVNPNAVAQKEMLTKLVEENNYEHLYYLFYSPAGQPIATFATDGDLTALINTFHADKIAETMEKTQENPLYLKAKINVELKLTPNK